MILKFRQNPLLYQDNFVPLFSYFLHSLHFVAFKRKNRIKPVTFAKYQWIFLISELHNIFIHRKILFVSHLNWLFVTGTEAIFMKNLWWKYVLNLFYIGFEFSAMLVSSGSALGITGFVIVKKIPPPKNNNNNKYSAKKRFFITDKKYCENLFAYQK